VQQATADQQAVPVIQATAVRKVVAAEAVVVVAKR
jgi:hypothetical protein